MGFTSTTAPNKIFESREELSEHYKSDLHKYNLKRKEAGLPAVTEEEFKARLEAALMLRREELEKKNKKSDHVKDKNKTKKPKNKNKHPKEVTMEDDQDVDPKECLFSNETFNTIQENIKHMENNHSFFIPDREHLIDEEGLIGYCAEKVKLGHVCLYCQKVFQNSFDCKKHMQSKGHCKICYQEGIDLHEFEVFYDFSSANKQFLGSDEDEMIESANEMDESDEEWEDIGSDEELEDDDFYDGYKNVIQKHGFGLTELGELILPNGKVVGHRDLTVFYKQRFAPTNALVTSSKPLPNKSKVLSGAGNGKGILVQNAHRSFTTVSLYRYRAALRKERRDQKRSRRQRHKTEFPINKMDKKGNRMITGVSVAHAPR